ncbi:MAG: MlaD family protein [Novosphingobium sp.]|nr:MlaD family protein [Novosphingobium sp.]
METRANHVWVGVITLVLLALLSAVIIWIARLNEGASEEYDIFFQQSVSGLGKGSSVSYSGVPVGKVEDIELWKKDPGFVRVRISVSNDVPVLIGTTATLQASFTGTSTIQLEGAKKDKPPIVEPGPEGVPVIPTTRGGFGEILANAPVLLERLSLLTENMNLMLSEENRRTFTDILGNTERMTDNLAKASPRVDKALAELEGTLAQATKTLAEFEAVAGKTSELLGSEGTTLAKQLRGTLAEAEKAMATLDKTLGDVRPALRRATGTTLPATEAAVRELRETSRALRSLTEKLDEQGAGALLKGNDLPDYKP